MLDPGPVRGNVMRIVFAWGSAEYWSSSESEDGDEEANLNL